MSALAAGGLITVLGLLFLEPLMRLLGSTDTILPYAKTYAIFILIAAPFMASSCVMNNILRYEGRAALAMVGLISGSVINIFGDWFLMTRCHLGVEGAGISTAVSQLISFGILFYMFSSNKTQSRLALRYVTREPKEVLMICKTGLPSLMRQGLSSVSTMMLNGQAGVYGDAAVAAMSIVNRICMFVFSVGLGIGQGFQPVSAFNYGAKKYGRVRKGFYFTITAGKSCSARLRCSACFPAQLVAVFQNDRGGGDRRGCAPRPACGAVLPADDGLREHDVSEYQEKRQATLLAMLRSGLCFIPVLLLLSNTMGLTGVEVSQTVADILSFFISLPFALHFLRELDQREKSVKI